MIDTVHICVAMKPLDGNFAQNALEHGVSGINVDGCRVATDGEKVWGSDKPSGFGERDKAQQGRRYFTQGRWPANVIHDGSDEVTGPFPDTGKSTGGSGVASQQAATGGVYGKYSGGHIGRNLGGLGDEGSASRFFKQCEPDNGEDE